MATEFVIPGTPMAKTATFTVYGGPVGKQRARYTNVGRYVRAYTPSKTVNYETLIRTEFCHQCEGVFFPKEVPVGMILEIYMEIPKSVSAKKRAEMLSGKLYPLKKPDSSNVLKSAEDALNKVAYADDSQICEHRIFRKYGEIPHIEITLYDLNDIYEERKD